MAQTFLQSKINHDRTTKRNKRIFMLFFELSCFTLFILGLIYQAGFWIAFGLVHGLIYLIHFPGHFTTLSDLYFFGFKPYENHWPFYRQLLILIAIEVCVLFMCFPFQKIGSIVFSIIGLSTALFLILLIVFQRRFLADLNKIIHRNR